MTIRPWTVLLRPATTRLLRLYRGEAPADVLHRGVLLLAQADGKVDTNGQVKGRQG
jgi:hypothetical protein